MSQQVILVSSTSGGSYKVQIGHMCFHQMLSQALDELKQLGKVSRVVAVVDSILKDSLDLDPTIEKIFVAGSETLKIREMKALIEDQLLELKCDKHTVLLAIGGGSIGDLTGFVAATFLRGIRFIQVPTTLLSMVDSSVGGKTGINTEKGKNLIGAFHQPSGVVIDTCFLNSLSDRLYSNGLAEIVKAGYAGDLQIWQFLKKFKSVQELRSSINEQIDLISLSIKYKARIVQADERDQGIRNELNFGHTIGHALELMSHNILHGECVSIGMVYELMCLRAIGFNDGSSILKLTSCLEKFNLPTNIPRHILTSPSALERFTALLRMDKKTSSESSIPVVAVKEIGTCVGPARTVQVPLNIALRVVCPFVQVLPLSRISGTVRLPGSKSIANRALLLAAMAGRHITVGNVPSSLDVHIMQTALCALGWRIENESAESVRIAPTLPEVLSPTLFVGNSGTSARFLLPFSALLVAEGRYNSISFTCDPRMEARPIKDLLVCLESAFPGIHIVHPKNKDCFPLRIERKSDVSSHRASELIIDGSLSSQFVSGILMMAPLYGLSLRITVQGLKSNGEAVSQPFIDMTVGLVNTFGGGITKISNFEYSCEGSGYRPSISHYDIPGDATAASYPLALAAVSGGRVSVNISDDGLQADFGFVRLLESMGCHIDTTVPGFTTVAGPLDGLVAVSTTSPIDMSNMTDTFMTAAVVLAVAGGGAISHIANQRVKECDRISAMSLNLNKCGFHVEETPDGLTIHPSENRRKISCSVETYEDHRIAMSMAVLSCGMMDSNIWIENPRCVEKTFPNFWDMLERELGIEVRGIAGPVVKLTYPVCLVGMRGIGKSTIGKLVGEKIGDSFLDLDRYIEEIEGRSVGSIIDQDGWERFRNIEVDALRRIVYESERNRIRTVVATGGGIIESKSARELLKQIQTVVWLRSVDDRGSVKLARAASGPAYADSVLETYFRRKPLYLESSSFDVYRTAKSGGMDTTAVESITRLIQPVLDSKGFSKGSKFVCLTAPSYQEWTGEDFQSALQGPGIEAVEIRVDKMNDWTEILSDYSLIRSKCNLPIILTLRSVTEGGHCPRDQYIDILERVVRLGPEWVDVEVDSIDEKMGEFLTWCHRTKFIASRHSCLSPTSELVREAVRATTGPVWADIGKVVFTSKNTIDSSFRFPSESQGKPVIGILMGANGVVSRVLNDFMTPVCSVDRKRLEVAAPGQLDAVQLDLIRSGSISSITTRFMYHLFGNPISKSPSPFMHNLMFGLKNLSQTCMYTPRMTSVISGLEDVIRSPFFRGASVTIPLKESVFDLIQSEEGCELSQDAFQAKSVNTISLTASGKLRGDNTDIVALRSVLRDQCKAKKTCVIVGTGGAARGAIVAALSVCEHIYVFGRDGGKVEKLCHEFPTVKAWNSAPHVDVVIACVPSSAQSEMLAHAQFPGITSDTTLVEMAYVPAQTPFVLAAASLGASVVYGSEILLLQAVEQHQIWIRSLEMRNELDAFFIPTEINPNIFRQYLADFTSRFHTS